MFFILLSLFLFGPASFRRRTDPSNLEPEGRGLQKEGPLPLSFLYLQDYQDKDEDFTQLQKRMEAYFKTFDRIEYDYWDRSIQIEGETATVIQQFHLEVEKAEKKNRYSGKEALFLKKEGGTGRSFKGL